MNKTLLAFKLLLSFTFLIPPISYSQINTPVAVQSLPANIEAENYSNMNGIQTENSVVASGGVDVGYIDVGDWLEYSVKVPTSGTYTITYRV
jgi:hypothetical protein